MRRMPGLTRLCMLAMLVFAAMVASAQDVQRAQLMVQMGNSNLIMSVAFSKDGRFVLTGSADRTAVLWNAANGKELRRFEGHLDSVSSVALSPDGKLALTGSSDSTARLWDVTSGKEMKRFLGHSAGVSSVALSPDGLRVLTGSLDNTARIWDAASGKELSRFVAGPRVQQIYSVAFSPDGRAVLTGGGTDHIARLWRRRSSQWQWQINRSRRLDRASNLPCDSIDASVLGTPIG